MSVSSKSDCVKLSDGHKCVSPLSLDQLKDILQTMYVMTPHTMDHEYKLPGDVYDVLVRVNPAGGDGGILIESWGSLQMSMCFDWRLYKDMSSLEGSAGHKIGHFIYDHYNKKDIFLYIKHLENLKNAHLVMEWE